MRTLAYGIKEAWSQKRVIWVAYALQVFFGILVALWFSGLLQSSLYHSINFETLLSGYDHTVISDWRNNHPQLVSAIMNMFSWMTLLFIPVAVYINGVLLHALITKPLDIKASLASGLRTYLPFFLVTLIALIAVLIWAILTLYPMINLIQNVFDATLSEPGLLIRYLIGGIVFYLGVIFILNWSITARTLYLRTSRSMWKCMRSSFKEVFRKPLQTIGTTTLFMILQVLLIAGYLWLEDQSGMISPLWVVVFFLVQQLFVLIRILWRLMLYSGIDRLHAQRYLTRVTSPL